VEYRFRLLSVVVVAMGILCGCEPGEIAESPDADDGVADAWVSDAGGESDGLDSDAGPQPGNDTDGDGLDDAWEYAAGDSSLLDWTDSDSDGDSISDADEDYDGDGLSNLEEFAASRLTTTPPGGAPHPFRVDLLVELDAMVARQLPNSVLARVAEAFAALPTQGVAGQEGVGLLIYRDEQSIAAVDFDDNPALRAFLGAHGPTFPDSGSPAIPYDKMVHVAVVTRRTSTPTTSATTVYYSGGGDIEETGAFVFYDVIDETHPACDDAISVDAARIAAMVHELGHILQLGHDTDAGGGINHYNIMALATNCTEAEMRFLGTGNDDESLGATQDVASSRFSYAAEALMDFTNKLSVDTSDLVDVDGIEM
jgi:hypothetical protein